MFSKGLKKNALLICKIADAPSSPMIDPRKARQMQAGALSGGTSMSSAWSNLKSGLGFGAAAPQDAGTLSR